MTTPTWLQDYGKTPGNALSQWAQPSEDTFNPSTPNTGFGTPTGIGNPQQAQAYGYADPYAMIGLGDSKFNPTLRAQLAGMGITELPAWMQHYTSANYDQTDLARALQSALGIDPAAWLGTDGKMQNAMHSAGVYKFSGDKAYDFFGNEVAWDDATKAAAQQAYLNRYLKENHGGFNMLGQEGLGLGIVLATIAGGMSLPALAGAGTGAAAGGGLGGGIGVPTTGADLGALGGSGFGGGSGLAGGGGMGFLDSLGSLFGGLGGGTAGGGAGGGSSFFSSIWPSLIQGGLGAIGSYVGGEQQKDANSDAINALMQMFNLSRGDTASSRAMLEAILPQFQELITGGYDYEADPYYQSSKSEMMKTLNRGQASVGKLRSSDTDNAIVRNLSTLQNQAYGRKYSGLLDALKIGSGAAASAGNNALTAGNALAGLNTIGGNNAATATGGMFGSAMGALNNWQLYNLLAGLKG